MRVVPEPLAQLIHEHRRFEATVAEAATQLAAAVAAPADEGPVDAAIERLWTVQLLLEDDVERHIAKAERVLPAEELLSPATLMELTKLMAALSSEAAG